MLTLKGTLIDFADCHLTLGHLGTQPVDSPLSFATGDEYSTLYQLIASQLYQDLNVIQAGKVLRRLKPVYRSNTYWHRYFGSGEAESYPDDVWRKLVPIEARLAFHLQAPAGAASVKVSPIPRVLLYPFGWSTWISLRLTGEYTLEGLADLVQHLGKGAAYTLAPGPSSPQTLRQVFRHIAAGVWEDAFGGGKRKDLNPLEVLGVTTVLDKFGGAPALQALSKGHEEALRRLVCPVGDSSAKAWKELIRGLPKGKGGAGNLDYALQDGYGVFIWADHLLKSEDRNRQHLRCYHNNTFFSLLHAWQLSVFLQQAAKVKQQTPALSELVEAAVDQIEQPLTARQLYRNACLISFLQRPDVQTAAQKAATAFGLKTSTARGS